MMALPLDFFTKPCLELAPVGSYCLAVATEEANSEGTFLLALGKFCNGQEHCCAFSSEFATINRLKYQLDDHALIKGKVLMNTVHWGGNDGRQHHGLLFGPLGNNSDKLLEMLRTMHGENLLQLVVKGSN